ncbi:MAG: hypothetical protein CL670_14805 [Balneola sp.]|jgi:hypothetical protein|nr:hypothetical protein [Balneola sp.]MBE80426.1 hypothetical protein [Balneola sp.]|tara:strand:- start:1963 stop:2415 length:453 start_codon:yes stop_codon:yes gene_type:complete
MNTDLFTYRHYDYVTGFGFPFVFVTLTSMHGQETKAEIIRLLLNYEKDAPLTLTKRSSVDVTALKSEGWENDQIFDFLLEHFENHFSGKVMNEGTELSKQCLPLKQRSLKIDALYHLTMVGDFERIKEKVSSDTVSNGLKNRLSQLKPLI